MNFATLDEVDPRVAWTHEAHAFTPWLASNLERLGNVLGIPLELNQAEAPVGRYAADILARNVQDGSVVLIENQLEWSDHTHLGQILTYLTGLRAETIVWVAPNFREEHLSALRWLNKNTVDPFAFFAVKVRVVRIGDSPLAPLFEVIERPNHWDRRLQEAAKEAREASPAAMRRRSFWSYYSERFPDAANDAVAGGGVARWKGVPGTDLVVSQWLAADSVGVFVRGGRGSNTDAIFERLAAVSSQLQERIGVALTDRGYPLLQRLKADTLDETQWDRVADWLHGRANDYADTLSELLSTTDAAIVPQAPAVNVQGA